MKDNLISLLGVLIVIGIPLIIGIILIITTSDFNDKKGKK